MTSFVFIAFQDTDNARYYVDAIAADNPHAEIQHQPAMIRVQAKDRLDIRRETVEERIGRTWDVQEMMLDVITLGGSIEEEEDRLSLCWN
ncbi:MmoB/DmpM family protein [Azotobacter beijerinckii]|uniref:MmoB/DmpM family protein n=1 Tax=Azotobacter beijerinckii TaxID=170623 RepID=UPI002953C9B0|nr:MmoB/DmpM family protein [Azotobacter beijerinckii]MDV7211418.1 MmoB/DmpM family protein [Azotobacter beijerinckii]